MKLGGVAVGSFLLGALALYVLASYKPAILFRPYPNGSKLED